MSAVSQTFTGATPPEPPYEPTTLQQALAPAEPVSGDVPHHLRARGPEPAMPECFTCGTSTGALRPDPRGRRYDSGAQVLYCPTHLPDPAPVDAAVQVMTAAMETGSATARDLAQAEHDAGLLFDPQRAEDIATAAAEQAHAEDQAELAELRRENAALLHIKRQLDGIRTAIAGRPDSDLMLVREIIAAADPRAPLGGPLPITWSGVVMGPSGDTAGERTLVPCTTSHGGQAALVLDAEQRQALGGLLLTPTRTGEACPTPGCGTPAEDLDASDPTVFGWVLVQVAGAETAARWWCSPECASDAVSEAGADLAAADREATATPADEPAPYLLDEDVPETPADTEGDAR